MYADYLDGLNDAQREAVLATDGPCLVVAGAGSGKTRVLTYRVARLLEQGVKPWCILALTFTNKAAKEMRERVASVVGKPANRLWMGTFHSIFARILRREAELLGFSPNFTIYDTTDSRTLVRQIVKELGLDPKVYKDNTVHSRISMAKNNLVTHTAYASNHDVLVDDTKQRMGEIYKIYMLYAQRCQQSSAMDFDDLLLYTNILFRDHPEALARYQQQFSHILVDEFQDTNYAQYLIVKRLGELHRNVCVVGDDAQSIYSFRGAEIQNILNFQTDYPGCKIVKLERNYRSTQTIVNAANSIIAKNERQIKKVAFSEGDQGERIRLMGAYTEQEEAFMVAADIYDTNLREHCRYADIAILYRTNAQSRAFEETLRKRNIPYRIFGGQSFYQRKEVKDMLAYLRLAVNPNDDEALRRVINYPTRGIGDTTVGHLQELANRANQSLWHTIEDLRVQPAEAIKPTAVKKLLGFAELLEAHRHNAQTADAFDTASNIARSSGVLQELRSDSSVEGLSRLQNVEELLNSVKQYVEQRREQGDLDEPITLPEYLANVALLTDMDQDDTADDDRVSVMTVHSSKGLEFDYVYLVGLEEGLFPSPMSSGSTTQLEEERRLFYVAVTRAAKRLSISFAHSRMQWGEMQHHSPSRFLGDIDPQYIEADARMAQGLRSDRSSRPQPAPGRPLRSLAPRTHESAPATKRPAPSTRGNALSPNQVRPNMNVIHERFGPGRVLSVEGEGPNAIALVDFGPTGQKKLVLQYAHLHSANQ
ncbi:MAG: UvrD-helicase domain-containing protein [Bacteroidales bacterium]|nr:UvrD-helicase domain-containing protein [Bacteroidales bacterium]